MRTRASSTLTRLALLLLLPSMILAQQNTTGGGDKGSPDRQPEVSKPLSRGRVERVERERDFRQRQEPSPYHNQLNRVRPLVRLSGKVVLADGSPLPGSVTVELSCTAHTRQQAFTFSDGSFTFEVGSPSSRAFADASIGVFGNGGLGVDLTSCELRAVLPGFQSERLHLGIRRPLDFSDVGNIVLRRLEKVSGSTVSFTALAAPKKARKAYEKATKELRKKKIKFSKVSKELEKAVEIYPQYATAWNLLGATRLKLKDEDGAREAFKHAIEVDPKYVSPYIELAMLEGESNRWVEVTRLSDRILELNPYISQAHYFSAVAHFNLGKIDLAAKSIYEYKKNKASKMFADSYCLAGAILASKGSIPSAAEEFRQLLKIFPKDHRADQIREHLTSWEAQGLIERAPSEIGSSDQSELRKK